MGEMLPKVTALFSREGRFARWLRVERALALAQGDLGIIPPGAAADIAGAARVEKLALERYDGLYEKTGHPMVALLRLLEEAAGPESGQFVHLGATTQDVMDTAMVLALQEVFCLTQEKLTEIQGAVLALCTRYADTPMMGRTHNVQALPITFGYKAAIWADELERCLIRLTESRGRILTLQLAGAVGSMVSFGTEGDAIQTHMARSLGLFVPAISWHTARDRLAEWTGQLALIAGCLGRIAREVYLLMGTELGELAEPWADGTVGSSTMPHKVNPTATQHMMSAARDIRYHHAAVLEMMWVEHERDLMHFAGERQHVEDCSVAAGALLDEACALLVGLQVNEQAMLRNLNRLGGLTQSEHVMLALGKHIGKQRAHALVSKIAVDAFRSDRCFEDDLAQNDVVVGALGVGQLHALLDPLAYLGQCPALARRVAQTLKK